MPPCSRCPRSASSATISVAPYLEEAAKLAENVLAPLNGPGDKQGCQYDPASKTVKTPDGFKAAYKQFAEGGWTALACTPEFGGQGLPHVLNMMVEEMVCSSNLSLGMYPGLTHGAINALTQHGTREQQEQYLPKLISGEWTGTMCLTEPQCGTDLGLIRTRAVPQADGSYAISGTKIWITGGEQDLVDNIIHLGTGQAAGCAGQREGYLPVPGAQVPRGRLRATRPSAAALSTRWASRARPPA